MIEDIIWLTKSIVKERKFNKQKQPSDIASSVSNFRNLDLKFKFLVSNQILR